MRRSLLLLFLTAACASGEAVTSRGRVVVDTLPDGTPRTITESPVGWADTNGWKLVEVARIVGGTEGKGDLVNPQSVTLDSIGNIYITDQTPAALKKYAPDGTYLKTLAREGAGPGEFQVGFIAVSGGYLFLQDPRQSRTSVYDTAGTFLKSWISFCCYGTNLIPDSAGNVGVSGMPPHTAQQGQREPYSRTIRFYRPDSTTADSLLVPNGPEGKTWSVSQGGNGMMTDVPWTPQQVFAVLPNRSIVLGYADHYLLAITRQNGADTVALFGRTWTPRPITDEARKAEVDRRVEGSKGSWNEQALRNAFLLSDVPTTAPAFEWIAPDGDGNLWVRTPLPGDTTRTLFDVFDRDLRWLGQVDGASFLSRFRTSIVGDRVIGGGEDDAGNPVVVVYRIQRS